MLSRITVPSERQPTGTARESWECRFMVDFPNNGRILVLMTNTGIKYGIKMTAKFDGVCGCCGEEIEAGQPIVFFPNRQQPSRVTHFHGRRYRTVSRPAWHLGCSRAYHADAGQDETGRAVA